MSSTDESGNIKNSEVGFLTNLRVLFILGWFGFIIVRLYKLSAFEWILVNLQHIKKDTNRLQHCADIH